MQAATLAPFFGHVPELGRRWGPRYAEEADLEKLSLGLTIGRVVQEAVDVIEGRQFVLHHIRSIPAKSVELIHDSRGIGPPQPLPYICWHGRAGSNGARFTQRGGDRKRRCARLRY
jgi:hypothetical protein